MATVPTPAKRGIHRPGPSPGRREEPTLGNSHAQLVAEWLMVCWVLWFLWAYIQLALTPRFPQWLSWTTGPW
jgi:hypothetical protein